MKKALAVACALWMSGCTAIHDGAAVAEQTVKNPPTQVLEALKTLLTFVEQILGVVLGAALHTFLPF